MKYEPSNGTEGEDFMERFCYRCKHYDEGESGCEILLLTMCYHPEDEEYPEEWVRDGLWGKCTAFEIEPPAEPANPLPPPIKEEPGQQTIWGGQ